MTRHTTRRLWVFGACFSLVAFLVLGLNYAEWKTSRLQRSAAQALEDDRPFEAALDAAAALQIQPGDTELTRLLGDAYEATNDERLLDVLSQQIASNPTSLDPRFRLAKAALRFGRLDISSSTIAQMPAEAAAISDFHAISSAIATIKKDGNRLLQHSRRLTELEPENPEHLLKLAGLAILAHDCLLTTEELDHLNTLRNTSVDACIVLWAISKLPNYPANDATELELNLIPALSLPNVQFETRLKSLDLATAIKQPQVADQILTLLKNSAAQSHNLDQIGVLIAWMNSKDASPSAITWARSLNLFSDQKPTSTLAAVLADCCAQNSAWEELDWIVTGTDWGKADFIRNFYAAKCAAQLPSETAKLKHESFLRLALNQSSANPAHIHLLWKTAEKYGWRDLTQPLSWTLVDQATSLPERRSVLQSIFQEALSAGDLDGFRRATTALLDISPGQWELRNNAYYAELLLDGCSPKRLAEIKSFHDEFKSHPDVCNTYAFALHLSGDSKSAATILNSLDDASLNAPGIAPFCAVIFQAAGDPSRAAHFRSQPHKLYFPQEHSLLTAALDTDK